MGPSKPDKWANPIQIPQAPSDTSNDDVDVDEFLEDFNKRVDAVKNGGTSNALDRLNYWLEKGKSVY